MVLSNETDITWTLAGSAGAGEPLRPSLAEWLTNDQDTPPGDATVVTTPSELTSALSSASPGNTIVTDPPGGSGTVAFWDRPSGITFPAGSTNNYITVMAALNKGVVISRGEDFAGARTPNNGFWTQSGLSQGDIDKHIWVSVDSFPGGEQAMMGWWIEFDHPHQLLRYSSLSNLRAAFGQGDSFTNYATPGVHKASDGRVYIRMQKPHPVKYSRDDKWSETLWPGHPEAITAGQLDYPKSQDPNVYPIYLTRVNTGTAAFSFASGGWAKVGAGINSMGHEWALQRGSDHIWCDRGTHYTWFGMIRPSSSSARVDNYFLHRVRCTDGAKLHASRAEWKFGGPLSGIRSICFAQGPSEHDSLSGVTWKDCTICDYHELYTGSKNISDHNEVRFRNCTMRHIFDDGLQARHSMSRVEIGYCYFYYSDWGGMGESGADGDDPDPGQWYVHHTIFDWRSERVQNWRSQPHPQDTHTNHSADGNSPRKIYNVTCLYGPDRQEEMGIGFEHAGNAQGSGGSPNNTLSGAANTHQVFNNIIALTFIEGTKRYDPVVTSPNAQYSDIFQDRSDYIGSWRQRYSADGTNELYDYNLYWRPSQMTVDPALFYGRDNTTARTGYTTLADWKNSSEFTHSQQSGSLRAAYPDGVDGNSTDVKPTMGAIDDPVASRFDYRPAAGSEVTTAFTGSLNGHDWWTTPPTWGDEFIAWDEDGLTLEPDAWKGALDPNGSTMPVGVQNP